MTRAEFRENLLVSFDTLRAHKVRSMLTLLGVVIGVMSVVRARLVEPLPMSFAVRNFGIILLSLFGFAAISRFVNMTVAIVFMVFFASLAASSYSWTRNLKVAVGLLAVAFALQKLLGLDLPLY